MERRALVLAGDPDADPAVRPWLAALADSRRRTLDAMHDLPAGEVDALSGEGPNAIGTPLYHVAAIEADEFQRLRARDAHDVSAAWVVLTCSNTRPSTAPRCQPPAKPSSGSPSSRRSSSAI